jgi:hypothetical protein
MCNVNASPEREEQMTLGDAKICLEDVLKPGGFQSSDLTGASRFDVCELAE